MTSGTASDPTSLTETFHHRSDTHSYTLKWRSFGAPTSPPLVFVHGTPWSSRVWLPYALALSRKFQVYISDNTGFGDSPPGRALPDTAPAANDIVRLDADLARQSEAFAALFKRWERSWGGKRPHVIAHDHGGLMSLRAYLLHGCRYASLCLIDVVAIGPFGQSLFKAVAENPQYFEALPDMAFEGILESYIRQAAFHKLPRETMGMLKEPWLRQGGKQGFVRQLCQANWRTTDAIEARYREVGEDLPVKVIWGKQDDWIAVETAERLAEALGAKEVVIIEEAGHLLMYDQAAQLGVELGTWVSTC